METGPLKPFAKTVFRKLFPAVAFRRAIENHYWDELEIGLLDLLVDSGRDAIDVGANQGRYTEPLTRLAKHVFAIEPNPVLARQLKAGLKTRRCTVIQRAVSDSAGVATLAVPTNRWGYEFDGIATIEPTNFACSNKFVVEKMTLDDLCEHDVGFLKIDIEGHELSALQGAKQLLTRRRPTILIESNPSEGGLASPSLNFLLEEGFRGYFVYRKQLHPLKNLEPHMYDQNFSSWEDIKANNRFTNTFLFFPSPPTAQLLQKIAERLSSL